LKEVSIKWLALRDVECGNIALLEENDAAKSVYEARLICQIKHNVERADQLLARYGASEPTSKAK
jgi:uncharacterized protein YecT (DUF1311 family)